MTVELVRSRWQGGERRVKELPAAARPPVELVVEETVAELRRRLGSRFSADELADLYEGSQRWTMALAVRVAPEHPLAWEQWVIDAAFARYLRDSYDWPRPSSSRSG